MVVLEGAGHTSLVTLLGNAAEKKVQGLKLRSFGQILSGLMFLTWKRPLSGGDFGPGLAFLSSGSLFPLLYFSFVGLGLKPGARAWARVGWWLPCPPDIDGWLNWSCAKLSFFVWRETRDDIIMRILQLKHHGSALLILQKLDTNLKKGPVQLFEISFFLEHCDVVHVFSKFCSQHQNGLKNTQIIKRELEHLSTFFFFPVHMITIIDDIMTFAKHLIQKRSILAHGD